MGGLGTEVVEPARAAVVDAGAGLPGRQVGDGLQFAERPQRPQGLAQEPEGQRRLRGDALALSHLQAAGRAARLDDEAGLPQAGLALDEQDRGAAPAHGVEGRGDGAKRCFAFEEGTGQLWAPLLCCPPRLQHGGDPQFLAPTEGHQALVLSTRPEELGVPPDVAPRPGLQAQSKVPKGPWPQKTIWVPSEQKR